MNIKYLLVDLLKSKSMGDFLTKRMVGDFYKFNNSTFKIIGTENANYYINNKLFIVNQAIDEYSYDGIEKNDIVLDIGACNGGFSLEVCNKVNKVFAVEPVFINELVEHINLNRVKNIIPLNYALGRTGIKQRIEFLGFENEVECKSLSELVCMCGGHVDVLKIDCEGGEWNINPYELNGIRKIEAEIHSFNGECLNDFTDMLIELGYGVIIHRLGKYTMLLSAIKK